MNDGLKIFLVFGIIGGAGFLAYKLLSKKDYPKVISNKKLLTLVRLEDGKVINNVKSTSVEPFNDNLKKDYMIVTYVGSPFLMKTSSLANSTIKGKSVDLYDFSGKKMITISIDDEILREKQIQYHNYDLWYNNKKVPSAKRVIYKSNFYWDITQALESNEIPQTAVKDYLIISR